jgi:hypothetical protein
LGFEELVRLAEVRPLDVPVEIARLDIQQDFVRQQLIENVDDRLALSVLEPDVDLYDDLPCR